jgi:hypothetical protein
MQSMREDVIGGFNSLLHDQQADGADARMTLVQFDSRDPHEVLVDAMSIRRVRPLTMSSFVPRAGTPLLDATGLLIARAATREHHRAQTGQPAEDITVVTITDGQENQSREYTRADIVRLVKAQQAAGWTFVFLAAGIDAYAEGGGMGYDAASTQAFAQDGPGAAVAFAEVNRALLARRGRRRTGVDVDNRDFFEGVKAAEADRNARRSR